MQIRSVAKKRWTPYFSRRGRRIFRPYVEYHDIIWDEEGRFRICPRKHGRRKDAERCAARAVRDLQLRREVAYLTDVVAPKLPGGRTPVNRTPILGMSPDVWRLIREMYGNRCYYCGRGGGRLQMEHRVPLARNGKNDISNIVPACERCNREKGIRTDDEYFKLLVDRWEYVGEDGVPRPSRPFPGQVSPDGLAVRVPLRRAKRLRLELPPDTKLCSACRRVLPTMAFGSHKGKRDGLASRCRECAAAAASAWRRANPEKRARSRTREERERPG